MRRSLPGLIGALLAGPSIPRDPNRVTVDDSTRNNGVSRNQIGLVRDRSKV
jgi:hypothetical protein